MRNTWMVGAALALAVSVSAQQPPENPARAASQNAQSNSELSPRDMAMQSAALAMIHKEYSNAVDIYRNLLRDTPNDAMLWNRLGIAYHEQSMLGDALKCYSRATKADKKSGDGWNNMGTIYFQEHKLAKAIRAYKKAIGLNPMVATFYSNMGIAYLNSKHVPEAFESFRHAVKLDPEVFATSGRVGTVLQDRTVSDRGMFFFVLAKSFATAGNAERCAYYLRKSRDEGYTDFTNAKTDPVFSGVLTDPGVRDVLGMPALPAMPGHSQGI